MAEKITPRSEDFSKWYHDLILQSQMADYSPVKGCMVIRPLGYAVWENLQRDLDRRIKETGTDNCYFPMFIPEAFLKKEAEHVEGFAPEVAVVTHAGGKDLDEKLVVRPTSETIINSMFSKWIQSYRDLPLLINQWANVVRWEMRTRLFLRTTEFLWQEGHTCHATAEESEEFTLRILKLYRDFSEEVLAVPVYWGLKTDSERFAGALRTYCIEAMMQDTKALQAGTSHNLSTNFAKAFGTQYLATDGKLADVHQTSWGVSTRLIGGVVMTHSDDAGLVLPPRLAKTHVAIVPMGVNKDEVRERVYGACDQIAEDIRKAGVAKGLPYDVKVVVDRDETKKPGWKFHQYELIGTPIRIDVGPRDLDSGQAVLKRRDKEGKDTVELEHLSTRVADELASMQTELLENARKFRDENTYEIATYDDFKKQIDEKGGFYVASWDQDPATEAKVKEETKATIRCILLDDHNKPVTDDRPCMVSGKTGNNVRVIYSRSY